MKKNHYLDRIERERWLGFIPTPYLHTYCCCGAPPIRWRWDILIEFMLREFLTESRTPACFKARPGKTYSEE